MKSEIDELYEMIVHWWNTQGKHMYDGGPEKPFFVKMAENGMRAKRDEDAECSVCCGLGRKPTCWKCGTHG